VENGVLLVCLVVTFFFKSGGSGILTQGFLLAKQARYCLSHSASPFCSDYFGDGDPS
jgi:hypothetical protein